MGAMTMPRRRHFSDCYSGHTDAAMDAALWGELQSHIDLAMIYAKVPLTPFFRLRQVCKEWNRLASDRQFLERIFKTPVANAFFVVTTPIWGDRLLTCQASSCQASSWSSMRVPPVKCEVWGLFFESHWGDNWGLIRIFDLHTRMFHTVPPIPTTMQAPDDEDQDLFDDPYDDPLIGFTVDTTLIPYSFKVILAHSVIGTRIYDSKSGTWTQKPSMYERAGDTESRPSCVNHNQFLYIKATGGMSMTFDLHAYDFQRDDWNFEMPDAFEVPKQDVLEIGLWRDRLFVFGLKFGPVVEVWETHGRPEQQWTLFDSMPGELCAWISGNEGTNCEYIQSKFCTKHVLVYNYFAGEEKAMLFNLDQKTWEKVVVPTFMRPLRRKTVPAIETPASLNNSL